METPEKTYNPISDEDILRILLGCQAVRLAKHIDAIIIDDYRKQQKFFRKNKVDALPQP